MDIAGSFVEFRFAIEAAVAGGHVGRQDCREPSLHSLGGQGCPPRYVGNSLPLHLPSATKQAAGSVVREPRECPSRV